MKLAVAASVGVLGALLASACGGAPGPDGSADATESSGSVGSTGGRTDDESRPEHLIFWSTLDEPGAIYKAEVGSALGAEFFTDPTHHFVPTFNKLGLLLNSSNEWIRFPQAANGVVNLHLDRGTLDLWVRPVFHVNDGNPRSLWGTGDFSGGGIRARKAGTDGDNAIEITVTDASGNLAAATTVAGPHVPMSLLVWVKIRIAWDFTVAAAEPNIWIWFDGEEPAYSQRSTGPVDMPGPADHRRFYLGAWSEMDPDSGPATLDEPRVFDRALPPDL